jgi:flagellar protein FlbD
MISLTRLNGAGFVLNAGLIERLETTPDTVVTLVNGDKHIVREDVATVVALIRGWHAEIFHTVATTAAADDDEPPASLHLVPDGERT